MSLFGGHDSGKTSTPKDGYEGRHRAKADRNQVVELNVETGRVIGFGEGRRVSEDNYKRSGE